MPNELGIFDSPGERARRERFQQTRSQVVDFLGPFVVEGLGEAAASTDQSLTELQGMMNLQPPRLRPSPRPVPPPPVVTPEPRRGPLLGLQEPTLRPAPLRPTMGAPDQPFALAPAPGQLVLPQMGLRPTGAVHPAPTPLLAADERTERIRTRGTALDPYPSIEEMLRAEVEYFRPLTEPVGRVVGRMAAERLAGPAVAIPPAIRLAGGPDVPDVGEIGAEVGAVVAPEVLVPTNLIPIPIVDDALRILAKGVPLAARLLKAEGRMATRAQLDELAAGARRLLTRTTDPSERQLLDEALEALVAERPMVGAAPARELPPFPEPIREPETTTASAIERYRRGEVLTPQEFALVQRGGAEVPITRTQIPEFEPLLGEMEEAQRAIPRYQRDLVGEELDRITIPTSRQVEASSKAVPPEVRAERAAPPPDVRVPMEDWTTVEARIGTRYRQNWWTKIDDVIGRVVGRNRQLETDVRNVMIVKDEYIRSQGGRMRVGVLDWIGRNREVLGLKTQGGRRGYAQAVKVRPGAKIAKGLRQHLDHITEHPDKYIISDEQARALQERQDIFENVLRAEQRHGVNVDELSEAYAPRVIRKTPKGQEAQVALTNVSTRYFKTRPWYTKARAIPDVEQLWAAGYRTLDPLSAMELRIASGAETIANVQALNRIKAMGYRPLERIRPQLGEELRQATGAHQAARKQALKTGSTPDKAMVLETEVRLDQATRDMRTEARLLAERGPKVLGRVVPPDVAKELGRYLETVPDSGVDEFLRLARASLVTTDYGSPLLQNWLTFWRDNPAWLKSFAHGASAVADNPYAFIVDHLDAIERGVRYGAIRAPEEFMLMRGGKVSQRVGELPIIRESQRAFEWNIFTAQTYRWEATEAMAKNADELFELASVLRKQSGSNFMPGLTARQARWLSRTWFAPQFTTALQGALVDPLVKRGPAQREALKTVAMAFGGAAVATVAINERLNGELPNMTDPDKPGFWAIRIPDAAGGGYVYPFGPFQPAIVALTRTGRAATAIANGEKPSVRDIQAWPRFVSNKASIGVRLMMRVGEAMGLPIETLRGPSFQEPEIIRERENILQALQRELGGYAPIGAAQAYRGISEGAPIAGLEFGGGRVTIQTTSQKFKSAYREEIGRDYDGTEAARRVALNNDRLRPMLEAVEREQLERGFEGALRREERAQALAELTEPLRRFIEGVRGRHPDAGSKLVREYSTLGAQAFALSVKDALGVEFPDPTTDLGRLVEEYYSLSLEVDPDTLLEDYATLNSEQDRILEEIGRIDPRVSEALQVRAFRFPEEFRDVELELQAVAEVRNQLRDIPQFRGISVEEKREADNFRRGVEQARDLIKRELGPDSPRLPSMSRLIRTLALAEGRDELFINQALALQSTARRKELLNPEYLLFIINNADQLLYFYPELETEAVQRIRSRLP